MPAKPPKLKADNMGNLLGKRIAEARELKGITQLQLAQAIGHTGPGVASSYISQVEAGKKIPKVETLIRLAEALGVTLQSLLPA